MTRTIGLVGLLALAACATPAATVKAGPEAPKWVTRGSGAFDDGGKAFYGVGIASGIKNISLRRNQCDAQARAAIAKLMNSYTKALDKSYQASTSGGGMTEASEEQAVSSTLKAFTEQRIVGADIVDHFVDGDGNEYALARLDFGLFNDGAQKVKDMNERVRQVIQNHADNAFQELEAESKANAGKP